MSVQQWRDFTFEGSPIQRRARFNESDNKLIIESVQPGMNDILAFNTALRNMDQSSSSLWGGREWRCVSRVPLLVIEKWWREEGINYYSKDPAQQIRVNQKLNDPEYSKFRVAGGNLATREQDLVF